MKEINKTFKVKQGEEELEITVKRPSSATLNRAHRVGVKSWTEAVRDGLFTKMTLLDFMYQNGIWDDAKESRQLSITSRIHELEKELALGVGPNHKLKVSEGKDKALEIRALRFQLRELISEKISLESNTAEGLSENSKFNFLVANCTFYSNGKKVFESVDDYESRADEEVAFRAAAILGQMMYGLDDKYEDNLPENQFLKRFNLVNEDLALVNQDGETVDIDGTKVNEYGWLVNDKGERIDRDGNLLSESGQILLQADYDDDVTPEEKKSKAQAKKTKPRRRKTKTEDSTVTST